MIRAVSVEKLDKFILASVQHDLSDTYADIRHAAINATLDAGYLFDGKSERISGRGTFTTVSWQALDNVQVSTR
jgi:hypothetical protein